MQFNQKTLIEFIKALAAQEEDILQKVSTKTIHKPALHGSDYERAVQRMETLRFKINDPVELGKDSFLNLEFSQIPCSCCKLIIVNIFKIILKIN